MTDTAPKWGEWFNTKAFPQRELETYDGMILDRETADADHLNALESCLADAEAALAFTEKDWLRVRDQRDAAEAALSDARAVLEGCWGQTETDDRLHFVIAVDGLPASVNTPEWVAEQVVEAINGESSLVVWRMGLPTSVSLTFAIDQSSRAALSRPATETTEAQT